MTTQRLCGPQGKPCKRNCGIDCHWNTAETPHDIAARHFWDASLPGYYEVIDAPLNWWDKRGFVGRACSIAGLIAVCAFVGVVVLV